MKKRVISLLLTLMLALSLVSPALAVEPEENAPAAEAAVVTFGELTKDNADLKLPFTEKANQAVTNQEAVAFLLRWAGLEESQLGSYPDDYNAMADSMGMTDGIANYDPTGTWHPGQPGCDAEGCHHPVQRPARRHPGAPVHERHGTAHPSPTPLVL